MRAVLKGICCAILVVFGFCAVSSADVVLEKGVYNNGLWGSDRGRQDDFAVISDGQRFGETPLYQFVNEMFGEAVQSIYGGLFTSSDQMFGVLGMSIDQTSNMTALEGASSQLLSRDSGSAHNIYAGDTLVASYVGYEKVNPANSAPISIAAGDFTLSAKVSFTGANYSLSSDPTANADGYAHFIGLDVTDLFNYYSGDDDKVLSAILFGLEDLLGNHWGVDWDYNDMIGLFVNVEKGGDDITPEPATFLIFGLGLAGIPLARRFRKK